MAFWHLAHSKKWFSQLLIPGINPPFHCQKVNGVLKLSRHLRTPENDHLIRYSLGGRLIGFSSCIHFDSETLRKAKPSRRDRNLPHHRRSFACPRFITSEKGGKSEGRKKKEFQTHVLRRLRSFSSYSRPSRPSCAARDRATSSQLSEPAMKVAWWSSALTPSQEGARSIPNPGTPFPTLGIGCFAAHLRSGWQVLFDSQHGSIGFEKSDTLQKLMAWQPEPDPQK